MNFEQAQDFVKIGHFTRKGGKIRGVVHVGANDGEEIEGYFGLGAGSVLAFEPLKSAYERLMEQWGLDYRVLALPLGLASVNSRSVLFVSGGDGKGSTFLKEVNSPYTFPSTEIALVRRFDFLPIDVSQFNTLVVDVQGMELDVLAGFGVFLYEFDFLNIECSRVQLYEGEASALEVIDFLSTKGFQQDSPIEDHNDIMFVHRRLGWPILF